MIEIVYLVYTIETMLSTDPKIKYKLILLAEQETIGDASETAMIKFVQPSRDVIEMRESNPKLAEIPFNSRNKFQLSIHASENPDDQRLVLLMKVIDRLDSLCSICLHMILSFGNQTFGFNSIVSSPFWIDRVRQREFWNDARQSS